MLCFRIANATGNRCDLLFTKLHFVGELIILGTLMELPLRQLTFLHALPLVFIKNHWKQEYAGGKCEIVFLLVTLFLLLSITLLLLILMIMS